jgi:serine phosphatase RsbU (regulator of sigma subunit)
VSDKSVPSPIRSSRPDPDEVVTRIYPAGDASIHHSVHADLDLLTVVGPYSPAVAEAIDRLARRCRGNLGLEFVAGGDGRRSSRPLSFDATVLRLLSRLQESCDLRKKAFFLCSPPAKLEDQLKLSHVDGKYRIVSRDGVVHGGVVAVLPPSWAAPSARDCGTRAAASVDIQDAGKSIVTFRSNLRRTEDLERGLDSAAECVKRFLPAKPPEADGFQFAHHYRSTEKVGGDLFDFIRLGDGHLGIVVGDVSGHGIDAALMMGISKKVIRLRAIDLFPAPPSEILKRVNTDLTPDFRRKMFLTVLYGVLDLRTGKFHFARAGHEPPIVFGHSAPRLIASQGVALGLGLPNHFDRQIRDASVEIQIGESVLVVTDGVAERRNEKGATYSRDRLLFECRKFTSDQSAQGILDQIFAGLDVYAGSRDPDDDMTAIVIKRTKPSAEEATK